MVKYVIKRILIMIPTLLGIILAILLFLNYIPGSGNRTFTSSGGGDKLDELFETMGVEDTLGAKYVRYCYNLITKLEFGPTTRGRTSIGTDLAYRTKFTLILTGLGFLSTLLAGIPLGIVSAVYKDKWPDKLVSAVSLVFSSIPSYCLTLFLVLFFSLWLNVLPVSGMQEKGAFVLPTVVLAIGGIALTVRMTRSAVMEVLDQPYITALRAKGLKSRNIIFGHVLKNSLVPIVSTINNLTVQMLCSTLVVENFFSIPGLGAYLINAVSQRDQYSILGCVIILSVLLMLIGLIADILCMIFNPKIRAQYSKSQKV